MTLTIVDVAKEAGVSSATVSRVMNGNYPVKEETRKKYSRLLKNLIIFLICRHENLQKNSQLLLVL